MKKFNTSDIFTGYLKQLLKTFNLPKLKVYTKEHQDYYEKYRIERADIINTITEATNAQGEPYFPNDTHYVPYIKDGKIQEYINGKWQLLGGREDVSTHSKYYAYGDKILNYTKNLVIQNNVYDSYTHEYLGDYLRFQRDYNELNLMPLYNCFSNRSCTKLFIKETFTKKREVDEEDTIETDSQNKTDIAINFNTADQNYKIYMVPVKLFQNYTIAIDSNSPVEFCCGIYGEYQDTRDKFKSLTNLSYSKVNKCQFLKPFLLNTLSLESTAAWPTDLKKEIAKNEADLKLFIKLPKDNNSTIVILEGNYLNWNDNLLIKQKDQILNIAGGHIDLQLEVKYSKEKKETKYSKVQYLKETKELIFDKLPTIDDKDKLYLVDLDLVETTVLDGTEESKTTYPTTYNNLYKAYYDEENEKGTWINLGTIIGLLTSDTIKEDKFKFIKDDKTYTNNDTIETAFQQYKADHIEDIMKASYIAYYNDNLKQLFLPTAKWKKQVNHSVINIEATNKGVTRDNDIPLITNLQLLQFNTGEQHPFANRLVEYLLDNVITSVDSEIGYNIRRVQKALESNNHQNNYYREFTGIWDYKMNKLIYEYMNTHNTALDVNHDILGYVDKDVEKYYTYKDYYTLKPISLINVELDEEDR